MATTKAFSVAGYMGAWEKDVSVQAQVSVLPFGTSYAGVGARYTGPGNRNYYGGGLAAQNGGLFAVIFSNRMFPAKAVAVWQAMGDDQHIKLVNSYFHYAGNFIGLEAQDRSPQADDYTDPVYVVIVPW